MPNSEQLKWQVGIVLVAFIIAGSVLLLSIPDNRVFPLSNPPGLCVGITGAALILALGGFLTMKIHNHSSAEQSSPNNSEAKSLADKITERMHEIASTHACVIGLTSMDVVKLAEDQVRRESLEKIKSVYDYTKFHVALYSVISAFLINIVVGKGGLTLCNKIFLMVSVGLFVLAGFAGGVIMSNVVHYVRSEDFRSSTTTMKLWLGVKIGTYKQWHLIQDGAFWMGIGLALYGIVSL